MNLLMKINRFYKEKMMNWKEFLKPTKLKVILALVLFVLLAWYTYLQSQIVCKIKCNPLHGTGGLPPCPPCAYPSYNPTFVILTIVLPISFYLLYSYTQYKKK